MEAILAYKPKDNIQNNFVLIKDKEVISNKRIKITTPKGKGHYYTPKIVDAFSWGKPKILGIQSYFSLCIKSQSS